MRRIRAGLDRYGPMALVAAAGNTFERRPGVRSWPLTLPIPAQMATAQHALVVDTAYSHDRGPGKARSALDPVMTQTGQQSQALIVPMRGDQKPHLAHGAPIGTQVASCSEHALVVPLRTHGKAAPAAETVFPTFVAGNAGHALLMRNNRGGGEMTTPVEEVARTITTKGHQSLVTLPFLTDYHGDGRPWQARGVDQPMGTVETRDRRALIEPAVAAEDCGFRMLEPHEIGRAMAFPDDYVVLGNKRERVRQYGNAVTPPVMGGPGSDGILTRCIASLQGREV